jgi:archaellum component FlaD/FlaE
MVGVDQAQIDKILSGASSEDPEARLDNVERELDFVKTSIKRLLIDLRERMNELDNPFTSAAASYSMNRFGLSDASSDAEDEDSLQDDTTEDMAGKEVDSGEQTPGLDDDLFPADLVTTSLPGGSTALSLQQKPAGKLKLQKVHRLFAWVRQGCSKYGHEHMSIMIDAYRSMGYINEDISDQIREIMRMVPETRRDVQEIGPNEFVSELYVLNRILDPEDATLDRDMIEVMLSHRRQEESGSGTSSRERDVGDTWIDLLDRI